MAHRHLVLHLAKTTALLSKESTMDVTQLIYIIRVAVIVSQVVRNPQLQRNIQIELLPRLLQLTTAATV